MCRNVQRFFTESVLAPVESFFTAWEEVCEDVRRWVETEVRTPVERFRETQEEQCRNEPCNWWTLCLNKVFCWLVTVVVRVVEFIIEVVGEWVFETVCRLVARGLRTVVFSVISVVRFLVTFFACIFIDPGRALEALGDFWFDIVAIIDDLVGIIDLVLDAISDLLDIVGRFVGDLGDSLGPIGRFFFGIVAGFIHIVSRAVDAIRQIVIGILEAVTSVLKLDFCTAVDKLIDAGAGIGKAIVTVTNVLSLGGAGAVVLIKRDVLRESVRSKLDLAFAGDSARLGRIKTGIGLDAMGFGLRWPVEPRRYAISSSSATVDLRAMHLAGTINLFAIAGYAPICRGSVAGFSSAKEARFEVVYDKTKRRVSLSDLRAYIAAGPAACAAFTVYPTILQDLRYALAFAKRKFFEMGIRLQIARITDLPMARPADFVISIGSPDGLSPVISDLRDDVGTRTLCPIPTLATFTYSDGAFGYTQSVRSNWTSTSNSGATARSVGIDFVFGAVLAHEMGHYFGLDHPNHDGLEYIMYAPRENRWDANVVGTLISYMLVGGEPSFSIPDANAAWDWIIGVTPQCLPA